MCHGALRPFHTLALVEERADSLSLLGARLQAEGVTLIALAPLLALLWLRVLDLRRDLDLGRDERPATFMATDALWMPVHGKALWLRWYITAFDKLLSLF